MRRPYRPLPTLASSLGPDGMAEPARLRAGDRPSSEIVPVAAFHGTGPMSERRAALDRWGHGTHTPRESASLIHRTCMQPPHFLETGPRHDAGPADLYTRPADGGAYFRSVTSKIASLLPGWYSMVTCPFAETSQIRQPAAILSTDRAPEPSSGDGPCKTYAKSSTAVSFT